MKKNKINWYVFLPMILIPGLIFADGMTGIENPTGLEGDLNTTIKTMLNGLLQLAMPFVVLAFIYVGFLFVKAQGAADKLQEARRALIWVMVGTAIVVGANAIYSMIEDTLNKANITTYMEDIKKNNV